MTTNNSGLNFTINRNFNPNQSNFLAAPIPSKSVFLTPPTPSSQQRVIVPQTPPPSYNFLAQIKPDALGRINAYRTAATESYQTAQAVGPRCESIRNFIHDLENPNIRNEIFVNTFKQQSAVKLFKQVCEEVSQAITGNRSAETGERLLNENFRAILRIRDYEGRSLLDQIAAHYNFQLESHRGNSELNNLGEILEKHVDLLQRAASLPSSLAAKCQEEAAKLKLSAIKTFEGLPLPAKGAVCGRIFELDGAGEKAPDYGYKTALADIQKILSHKGSCPIKDAIAACAGNSAREPVLTTSYVHTESIKPTDSAATAQEIKKLYELEDLNHFLNDPFKDNDFLESKYRKLSHDVSDLLNRSIWLASYQPIELGFSENFVSKNVRVLLEIKNQQAVNIISQLISHQQEKIKGLRLVGEIEPFVKASTSGRPPAQLLNLFNGLSDGAKEEFRGRVWKRDGGEKNPSICGWKNFFGQDGFYGTRKIESDPNTLFHGQPSLASGYLAELKGKTEAADKTLLVDLETSTTTSRPMPETPIDVSSSKLVQEKDLIKHLPPNLKVAHVTAELSGVASMGGLGSAIDGMIRGSGEGSARVIMPLYHAGKDNGPIADSIRKEMIHKPKYDVEVYGRKHRVLSRKCNGIKCYFIEDLELFYIPPKRDGTSGNLYEYENEEYLHRKYRWAVFQSAAAEVVYKLSKKAKNPIQLVHVHDSQTALVPKFLAARHPEEWKRGETPATMFTFHNNHSEPGAYDNEATVEMMQKHGLPRKGLNAFIEGLIDADVTTTVSETFGKEAQTQTFGKGMHNYVKRAAFDDKLFAITNGNSNGWDPTKDEQLQNWRPLLPTTRKDLRFGPDSPDLAEKIKTCQHELCAYLKSLPFDDEAYADLDPKKPIVTYVGRYDWTQKGIDKFKLIMEETLKNGGQFVCMGSESGKPGDKAYDMLASMKAYAKANGKKGVLILEDRKVNGKYVYQGVFGNLARAATSIAIYPSEYEPCGLGQGEFNRFGKKVIATETGGLADTLKAEGPDANGYLFKRCHNWFSPEQDKELTATLKVAVNEAKAMQEALYLGDANAQKPYVDSMRTIMRNALMSTWTTTPDGSLSPSRRIELAMAKAFQHRKERYCPLSANLKTLKI